MLGKTIDWVIDSDRPFIVYIDTDGYVEWTMNNNEMLGPETGPYQNMIGWLEAVDTSHLADKQKQSYARMIGEGMARLFQKNLSAAKDAFDLADKWITARNAEMARRWYLFGSGIVAAPAIFAALALGYCASDLCEKLGPDGYKIAMGTAMGGLGAWLSVIQGSRKTELDVAAGPTLHYLEGALRIIVGMIGAFLIALAIHARLIFKVDDL